ncbi:MAG: hypothetical protein A4E64_03156 [Syntrophorhabdus sp. PtaU1.Bin058]|nr:MAG: hypothetical protein A4E64_03156 [Syntrophorhabdus sp. PtaU1.Bin058]
MRDIKEVRESRKEEDAADVVSAHNVLESDLNNMKNALSTACSMDC